MQKESEVTEKAIDALSQGVLADVVRFTPASTAVLDLELRYLMVSQRWVSDYEIAGDKIIGKSHYEVVADIPDRWKKKYQQCLRGEGYSCELDKFERSDGEILWLRWSCIPWFHDQKVVGGIIIFSEVVSHQVALEQRLKESEERYSFATGAGEIGVWDWDVVENFLIWDPVMHQLFDLPMEDFHHSYEDFNRCVHPEDVERVSHEVDLAIRGARFFDSSYRVCWRDGSVHYIHARAQVHRDHLGNLVRMTGVCYDVTISVESRLKLKHTVDQLEIAQSKLVNYSKMLESALEGISQIDVNGYYIYTNEAYAQINGYEVGELIHKPWEQTIYPEDIIKVNEAFNLMRYQSSAMVEARGCRKDGRIYYIRMILIAYYDEVGSFDGNYCIVQDVSEQKRAEKRLEMLALFDSVTSLPNRANFLRQVSRIICELKEKPRIFAVLFLDLDNFKRVNDTLGHHQGDIYLREIAEMFKRSLGRSDFLARLGGDEFVVIIDPLESISHAKLIAESLLSSLKEPLYLQGCEFSPSVSIGISVSGTGEITGDELIQQADMAMYRAKTKGPGHVYFYSETLKLENQHEILLEQNLRHAIEREELSLAFQPQIELYDQGLIGFESLLRWKNADLGEVSPEKFIPAAEKLGLIEELGCWVMDEACRHLRQWREQYPDLFRKIKLSINCSSLQLNNMLIVDTLKQCLRRYELSGELFIIEITETVMMRDTYSTVKQINALVDCGVEIAIDDFGKGYSSLNYLRQLPISYLKIDQSFVADIYKGKNHSQVVKAIVDLAKAMDIKVIAEGIENHTQYTFLLQNNCQYGQGNYIQKPLSVAELHEYIKSPDLCSTS